MKKYIVKINDAGDVSWYNEDGQLHREEGPAVEYSNGTCFWYRNDVVHREDGPAVVQANGYVEWRINGLRHREDGPAIETSSGIREWWVDGKMHREDGPAIEDGFNQAWFINGESLTEDEFNDRTKKELTVAEIESLLGYTIKIVKE